MRNTSRARADVKRLREFKKALLDEGITLTAFAKRIDIHRVYLSRALRDPSIASQRVNEAIDALIAKHSASAAA